MSQAQNRVPPGHKLIKADPGFKMTAQQTDAVRMLGGPQRYMMLVGGARSQKTFTLVRQVVIRAAKTQSRHLITRFRNNSIWPSIAMDTLPKVMRMCFPGLRMAEHKQLGYFRMPNDSEIWLGGLDDGERVEKILGNEYATIYFNECSQIPYASILTALTRLAQNVPGLQQRAFFDLNPTGKGHYTNTLFVEGRDPVSKQPLEHPEDYSFMYMSPGGNAVNLSPAYIRSLEALPDRQRKRFLEGRYAEENENALWTYEVIEQNRRTPEQVPSLQSVVVSVDPSGAKDDNALSADPIGITVVGLGVDGHGYLLADLTMLGSPAVWAKTAIGAFYGGWAEQRGFRREQVLADHIVAEINYGGAMVEAVIKAQAEGVGDAIPVRTVTATRGKAVRAEPVSAIYEAGRFHHVGRFAELEDELCSFTNLGYLGERSPNRADALIWAASDLKLIDDAQAWIAAMDRSARTSQSPKRPVVVNELLDQYIKSYESLTPGPIKCSREGCEIPMGGERITDGERVWHKQCYHAGV